MVDYDDPEYEVTLLVTSTDETTLFDLGGIMNDIEEQLGIHAFVVTRDSYEATAAITGNRPRVLALVRRRTVKVVSAFARYESGFRRQSRENRSAFFSKR